MTYLHGCYTGLHVIARNILEKRMQVEGSAHRLADDSKNGLMIELGIVEAIQKMNCARARQVPTCPVNWHAVSHEGGFLG